MTSLSEVSLTLGYKQLGNSESHQKYNALKIDLKLRCCTASSIMTVSFNVFFFVWPECDVSLFGLLFHPSIYHQKRINKQQQHPRLSGLTQKKIE